MRNEKGEFMMRELMLGEVRIDIRKTVEEFFKKYADKLDREHNVTIEKECEEDWDENWAIFFVFDRDDSSFDEFLDMTIYDVAEMLEKEFKADKTVKVKVWEESHEIEVYRD